MLSNLVEKAQKGDDNAMMELINQFSFLFKKYARKLNYEDAYEDIRLYFIELIKSMNLKKLQCLEDGVIVSYINVSIKNFYNKKIRKILVAQKEIVLSELTEEQEYYVEVQSAKEDERDIFMELGMNNLLNENECKVIYLIYLEGYTTTEIARATHKSKQAVNQLKHRALDKIKRTLHECSNLKKNVYYFV